MLRKLKIFILVSVVYILIFHVFLSSISSSKPKITQDLIKTNRAQIYNVINDPANNSTKEGKQRVAWYRTASCQLIGEACTDNPADGDTNVRYSAAGYATQLLMLPLAHPPASGMYWARNGLENAGFIPQTYAAEGIGFAGLKPFLNLWKVFRDISYLILVLLMVSMGFMIMFRMKLNAQTVLSVETALPRIVFALILITFSFAIAGFLIDLMYVIIAIIISLMSNNDQYYSARHFQDLYLSGHTAQIFYSMFPLKDSSGVFGALGFLYTMGNEFINFTGVGISAALRLASGIWAGLFLSGFAVTKLHFLINLPSSVPVIGGVIGTLIGLVIVVAGFLVGGGFGIFFLPGLILGAIILLTMIFLLFRIFFLLLRSYLQILILVIFAPLILLFEAVPGKNSFSYWFKNLFAEILAFPIVIAVFILGYIIANTIAAPQPLTALPQSATEVLYKPTLWAPPFLGSIRTNVFAVIAGMGLIFIIPDIVKLMKDMMGVKGLPISIGPGAFFSGAGAGLQGGMGIAHQYSSLFMTLSHTGLMKPLMDKFGPKT